MGLLIECVVLCLLMWLICFLGTGTDDKNLKSFQSYPLKVQEIIRKDNRYKGKYNNPSEVKTFIANLMMFTVIILFFGFFIIQDSFLKNFVALLILGQVLNVFDLLVIDLLWWRNSKRVRFKAIDNKELYKDPKKHIDAFLRAIVMFTLVALIDGFILTIL